MNKKPVTLQTFLENLNGAKDVQQHYLFISELITAGEIETLEKLFFKTLELNTQHRTWPYQSVSEHIVSALALHSSYRCAQSACHLCRVIRQSDPDYSIRSLASKMASVQSSDTIHQLLASDLSLDMAALLIHESLFRDKLDINDRRVAYLQKQLAGNNHPLGVLPSELLMSEGYCNLPVYGLADVSIGYQPGPGGEFVDITGPSGPSFTTFNIESPERQKQMMSAVQNWVDHSNGRVKAQILRIPEPEQFSFTRSMPTLGLDYLVPGESWYGQTHSGLADVFLRLHDAASNGGAYNSGEFAAFGRLRAWQSLSGLMGVDLADPVALDAMASDYQWFCFSTSNDWFEQVCWDLAVACWNPGARELSVLAATDTD